MAYPTVDAPYGLKPVKLLSGVPYVGTVRQYSIASGYSTDIFYGDAVKLVTGGTVERDTFDAAMTPIGVFMGVSYTDPSTSQVTFRQYYPASTAASDIKAYVCDATDVLFKAAVVSSGTTSRLLLFFFLDLVVNISLNNDCSSCVNSNSLKFIVLQVLCRSDSCVYIVLYE